MSTPQNTLRHHNSIRTRPGTALLALAGLIAIGLALLILLPTGHQSTLTTNSIAQRPPQAVALTGQTPALAGCFRDPATHALTCSHAAPAPTVTAATAGYFRDPATHKLLRVPTARHSTGQQPANHSRGRIIP